MINTVHSDSATGRVSKPASMVSWLGALLRRHWLAAVLMTAGLALRALVLAAYRPAIFYQDTTRYLYHASGNDPVGYRVPLRGILLVGNLNTVAAIQHLLGVGMAITLYCLLQRRGVARWLAALAIAPVLLDAYQLQLEQMIMPDVWFEALIVAGLTVLLWRAAVTWRIALAAGLVLGAAVPVRQVGEILILPAVGYVLVTVPGWRAKLTRAIILCAAFLVPFLAYCTASYVVVGDFALSHTGVTTTYGRMAYAADCGTLKLTAAQRPLCPNAKQHTLGPDGLLHNPSSPLKPIYRRLPHADASRLVESFNEQVISQQPGRVVQAIGTDFLKLFAVHRATAPGDDPISRWQFQLRYPYMYPHASPVVVRAAERTFGGGPTRIWLPVARFLRSYQLNGGYTPGPLLLACMLAGIAGALAAFRRRIDSQRRALARGCLAFIVTIIPLLLISDLFVYSWRYQLPALVTLPPAAALALACLLPWPTLRAAPPESDGQGLGLGPPDPAPTVE